MGIQIDPYATPIKLIRITSPQTEVTIQELVNTIRDWEDSDEGIAFGKIIDATGKDDLGGGVLTGITMTLSSQWRIKFWSGVGLGIVRGGNLVGGCDDQPIEPTGGDDTVLVLNSVSGTISEGAWTVAEKESHIADQALISKIERGRWKIENNQMIFYDEDGETPLLVFNLKDQDGQPTMDRVYERVPVT